VDRETLRSIHPIHDPDWGGGRLVLREVPWWELCGVLKGVQAERQQLTACDTQREPADVAKAARGIHRYDDSGRFRRSRRDARAQKGRPGDRGSDHGGEKPEA
jgi:hypothetical protein